MNAQRFLVALWLFATLVAAMCAWVFPQYRFLLAVVAAMCAICALIMARGSYTDGGAD